MLFLNIDLIVAPLVESAAKFAFIASRCSRSRSKNIHSIERQIASVILGEFYTYSHVTRSV